MIDKVEGTVIDTIVSMVLKMTEGTLRPMLLKVMFVIFFVFYRQ